MACCSLGAFKSAARASDVCGDYTGRHETRVITHILHVGCFTCLGRNDSRLFVFFSRLVVGLDRYWLGSAVPRSPKPSPAVV